MQDKKHTFDQKVGMRIKEDYMVYALASRLDELQVGFGNVGKNWMDVCL